MALVGSVGADRVTLSVPRAYSVGYRAALRGRIEAHEGSTVLRGRFGPSRVMMAVVVAMVVATVVVVTAFAPGGSMRFPLALFALVIIVGAVGAVQSSRDRIRIEQALRGLAGFSGG